MAAESQLVLDSVVASDTVRAKFGALEVDDFALPTEDLFVGDGFVGLHASDLQIVRSIFSSNARAGMFFEGCDAAAVHHSLIVDSLLGLVLNSGSTVADGPNAIYRNQEDRVDGGGLFVAPIPEPTLIN
jgi:hypothetical protein